jgi:endonuclease/exonuclease/phosphatase family metal-dependent hydrolase
VPGPVPVPGPVTGLRVVSWNVRDLLGDPAAVRRVLRVLAPDVALLQEVPRRPGAVLRTRRLAAACGLRHALGGRDSGGTALLLAPDVGLLHGRALRLPVAGVTTRTRGAVVARVRGPDGGRLSLACVHLPLRPAERVRHVLLVAAALRRLPGPHLVGGDLNEPAGGPAWRAWEPLVHDLHPWAVPTFPAGRAGQGAVADRRIDGLLAGPGLDVTVPAAPAVGVLPGGVALEEVQRASDHLPVVAVVRGRQTTAPSSGSSGD